MTILIVDDHPLTVSVYETIIREHLKFPDELIIKKAFNCREAYYVIQEATSIDLAIIDYSLPSFEENKLSNGADLALLIKEKFIFCKNFIITSHNEILILYDIIRKSNPQGIITKNEINSDNLANVLLKVLQGEIYKSEYVKKSISEVWKKKVVSEEFNRKILLYLSRGYKVKDLEVKVSLSTSAIQKRVTKLKLAFMVKDERELIREVFEMGYL